MADDSVPSGTFADYWVTTKAYALGEDGGRIELEAGGYLLLESSVLSANVDAKTVPRKYEICQRSGFRAEPGQLVKDWTGLWVLPRFREQRNEQQFVRSKPEKPPTQKRPEKDPVYLTTNQISSDDL